MSTGRADWHRRAAVLPLGYLGGVVGVGLFHPLLPSWEWLAVHLLLLGAATNAILVWSAHFTAAVLRAPAPPSRRGEVFRLVALNVGVVTVLVGGVAADSGGGPLRWVGVAGTTVVFLAVLAHLGALARQLRAALAARFAITVRYYLAAGGALLTGIPVGGWMLVVDDVTRPRLLLFHAHINLLGWITLTVLGTLLTLWPTVLRTRMADGAVRAATRALPLAGAGLGLIGVGLLVWWRPLAAAGLGLVATAVLVLARPAVAAARRKTPASFAAWSIAAALGWLLVALAVDGGVLLTADDPEAATDGFGTVLVPLLAGFVGQVLLGSLAFLLPMVLGGGPLVARERAAILDRHGATRVVLANAALVSFQLPTFPYVRITTSLLVLAALLWFLIPAGRVLWSARRPSATPGDDQVTGRPVALPTPTVGPPATSPASGDTPPRALTDPAPATRSAPAPATAAASVRAARPGVGVAAGLAVVLVAVLLGVVGERLVGTGADLAPLATDVPATGHTTTVRVTAAGMRFRPDRVEVPVGDRLVIELTNADDRRHDLVLATGPRTGRLTRGGSARLDAGVIGAPVEGWCSLPGHRQAGMVLTVVPTGAATAAPGHHPNTDTGTTPDTGSTVDPMADPGSGFTAREARAPAPADSRVHRWTLRVREVVREVSPGVRQRLWTFNGATPGPVLRGRVGDTFEITLVNDGSLEHGVDFHASALAPDGPMRPIDPGQRLVYRFTATKAGVWMYHCSATPMLHHIGNGMYGAVIIDPPDLPAVDHEYVLVQSELYLGPSGEPGDLTAMRAERPDAVVFNGYVAQYTHRPLTARAGERVRIWLLNAGPNRASAFHVVGAQFDTVYREGQWRLRPTDPGGAQLLDLGPASGGFVETVFPAAGHYPFVTHAMVDAERGAHGVFEIR